MATANVNVNIIKSQSEQETVYKRMLVTNFINIISDGHNLCTCREGRMMCSFLGMNPILINFDQHIVKIPLIRMHYGLGFHVAVTFTDFMHKLPLNVDFTLTFFSVGEFSFYKETARLAIFCRTSVECRQND